MGFGPFTLTSIFLICLIGLWPIFMPSRPAKNGLRLLGPFAFRKSAYTFYVYHYIRGVSNLFWGSEACILFTLCIFALLNLYFCTSYRIFQLYTSVYNRYISPFFSFPEPENLISSTYTACNLFANFSDLQRGSRTETRRALEQRLHYHNGIPMSFASREHKTYFYLL